MNILKNFIVILIFFFLNISFSYSNEKTVYLDIDYVLNNSNFGKSIYLELDKLNKKNIKLLNSREKEIQNKKDSINKKKNIVSEEVLSEEISLFNSEVEAYKLEKDKIVKNFNIKKKEKLDNFLKEINPIIQEYMKNESIDIILEKNQIFIGNSSKDITMDIIELVNKKL